MLQALCLALLASALVKQPALDTRRYATETLPSGLRVLYVQDPGAPKSGFSASVATGSLDDPVPGLAHMTEHAVFLGSRHFPEEGDFDSFLAAHGGDSNAYTAEEHTVFYGTVDAPALPEALARFADTLAAPLLDQDRSRREVSAVNAEHEKNKPVPERRAIQLLRDQLRGKQQSHFFTGNKATLDRDDLGSLLHSFVAEHYCAPRMSAVVSGPQELSELKALVAKSFANVTRACKDPPAPRDALEYAESKLVTTPTTGQPMLAVGWALPGVKSADYRSLPWRVAEFVLTSEAPTSWLADARKRGVATDVSVTATATGGGTLGLAFVTLTAEGQKDPRGVLASLLRYLEEKPTQELVTSLQQLSRVQFDTLEDDSLMDAVERWGAGAEFAPEDVLAGGRVMLQVDMPLVESMFANLTAAHLSAVLLDPGFAAAPGDKHEEWYDAPYRVEPLALVGKPRLLRGGATFPPALQYVPTLLAVQNASAGAAPEELRPRVWWQGHGNARRKLPTATVFVKLAREGTDQALGAWAAEAVQELAADAADPFTSAGLDMGVEYRGDALQFTFSGYDQYLPDFMAAVLPAVRRAAAAPSAKLKAAQARAAAQYDDPEAEAAYEYALEALSAESNADRKPRREVARALHAASVADLRHWLEAPVAPVQLYYGNVNRSAADQAARHVEFLLGSKKAAPGRTRVRQLAARSRWSLATPAGSDTVSLVAFQTQPSVAQRANLVVLGEFLRPLVYQKLRTEQSLGYIVDAFVNAHLDVVELKVLIQGSKDPAEMSSAVFACLDSAVEDLRALPDSQVHALRAAATTALTTDASMDHEAKRLWHEVHSDQRCFARRAAEAEELASVTAASLVATLQGLLAAGSSRVELSPNATDEALNATTTLFPVVACH